MFCAFCGRENDAGSRYCIDCGKPMNPSSTRAGQPYSSASQTTTASTALGRGDVVATAPRAGAPVRMPTQPLAALVAHDGVVSCPNCGQLSNGLPFCGYCGTHIAAMVESGICTQCGSTFAKGIDLFCARCGKRVGQRVAVDSTAMLPPPGTGRDAGPRISLLGETGEPVPSIPLNRAMRSSGGATPTSDSKTTRTCRCSTRASSCAMANSGFVTWVRATGAGCSSSSRSNSPTVISY